LARRRLGRRLAKRGLGLGLEWSVLEWLRVGRLRVGRVVAGARGWRARRRGRHLSLLRLWLWLWQWQWISVLRRQLRLWLRQQLLGVSRGLQSPRSLHRAASRKRLHVVGGRVPLKQFLD